MSTSSGSLVRLLGHDGDVIEAERAARPFPEANLVLLPDLDLSHSAS